MHITKAQLLERLQDNEHYLTNADVKAGVNLILDLITQELASGGRVEVRGFGAFKLNHRGARTSRNPKSGASVQIDDQFKAHFKPGKELRSRSDSESPLQCRAENEEIIALTGSLVRNACNLLSHRSY